MGMAAAMAKRVKSFISDLKGDGLLQRVDSKVCQNVWKREMENHWG